MICESCNAFMETLVEHQRKNKKIIIIWCPNCGSVYINKSGNSKVRRPKSSNNK